MQDLPQTAVVTGAGHGIGEALATELVARGYTVVVSDVDADAVGAVAEQIGATAVVADLSDAGGPGELARAAIERLGRVGIYFSNAGVDVGAELEADGSSSPADEQWQFAFDVNLMAHVRAARVLLPHWLKEGGGRFVLTASAAGLLTMIGNAPYSVTKHATVAYAEWLAITYGDRGIAVQAICPQGVNTRMLRNAGPAQELLSADAALEPSDVARLVVDALGGDFLILPHPQVAEYYRLRAGETDRWLGGMRRLHARTFG